MSAETLIDKNFSLPEVGVLMALMMCDWNVADAMACFEELGGHQAVFDRILIRLKSDRVVKQHPRKGGFVCLDQLSEALRLRYERAVQAREAVNGATNS